MPAGRRPRRKGSGGDGFCGLVCQRILGLPSKLWLPLVATCSLLALVPTVIWMRYSFEEDVSAAAVPGGSAGASTGLRGSVAGSVDAADAGRRSLLPASGTAGAASPAGGAAGATGGLEDFGLDGLYDGVPASAPASQQTRGGASGGGVVADAASAPRLLGENRAVLVVVAHNNVEDLERCLRSILEQRDVGVFSLAVSLDDPASFEKMEAVVTRLSGGRRIEVWRMPADAAPAGAKPPAVSKIAGHFRFAISEAFERRGHEFAIFVENDLTLSPDFLWYFRKTAWLLETDSSLFCVSAWNDNGFTGVATDEKRLFRTDYFPGLGWMIRNDTWSKIAKLWPRYPSTGWDHWLRHGSGLRPRECIAPEVPRVKHNSEHGTNVQRGSKIAKLLARMAQSSLPSGQLDDVSYLVQPRYDEHVRDMLRGATQVSIASLSGLQAGRAYLLPYVREEYSKIAQVLQLYPSQPRTAHRGLVLTRVQPTNALLAVVDRRQAQGLLPDAEQWHPNPGRTIAAARPAQSCAELCGSRGQRCSPREFEWANTCETMKAYFACDDGCGHQVGQEIPAFVHDRSRDTAGQCLVTDEAVPTCEAKHVSTTRLCVCIPA
eukprot:TRINITY_DN4390_c3_g1_i1.p1 TRINITY_DN4390_c3_g1~~TRINITY_DN4390_c3_g1_i1.p1  ORF type:complete len:604 (-),score=112.47 TRINITY_DN4390_c3_g1_i1:62-1873(-)